MRHAPDEVFALGLRSFARLAMTPIAPHVGRALGLIGRETTTEDALEFIRHMAKIDPASVRWMALSGEEHSAWDVLPQVRVPLLIIAGDQDPLAPARRVAIPMHLASPHSELVRLPRGTHTALLDHADTIGAALGGFFERIYPPQRM
jgi:pimeloyl-ACP methyl ester carboxylesterase